MAWPLSFLTCADANNPAHVSQSSANTTTTTATTKPCRSYRHHHHHSVVPSSLLALLQHFESPGDSLPPSNRVGDPKVKQKKTQRPGLLDLWKYGAFAAVKASHIFAAVVSHSLHGPPRKSWGIEISVLCGIMRDTSRYSHLTDVTTLRFLMSLGGLAPVPSDAMVTPVTFRVRKRQLRGILAQFDAEEDGSRELSGEWVVGKRTWQRLQHERKASRAKKEKEEQGKVKKETDATPTVAEITLPCGCKKKKKKKTNHAKKTERVILYLHGGAYYMLSPATHRTITISLSKALDARLFAVDYRLAPETRFPGPLHDAVSTYFRMIDDLHIAPQNIIVAGDSAGGGLALALMMYLRDNGYPLPGGGVLLSPWVDLTMSCDSWDSNMSFDIVPLPQPGDHMNPILCYLGEHMEQYLTHPYASPLFGNFEGLPPLLIQGGDAEVLRDEITLLAYKASLAGVEIRYELYEDMFHVFQILPFLESSSRAFVSARHFVRDYLSRLDRAGNSSVQTSLEGQAEEELEHEIDNPRARVVKGDGTESGAGREVLSVVDTDVEGSGSENESEGEGESEDKGGGCRGEAQEGQQSARTDHDHEHYCCHYHLHGGTDKPADHASEPCTCGEEEEEDDDDDDEEEPSWVSAPLLPIGSIKWPFLSSSSSPSASPTTPSSSPKPKGRGSTGPPPTTTVTTSSSSSIVPLLPQSLLPYVSRFIARVPP